MPHLKGQALEIPPGRQGVQRSHNGKFEIFYSDELGISLIGIKDGFSFLENYLEKTLLSKVRV